MRRWALLLALTCLPALAVAEMPEGDPERGRLIFGQCRTCHYPEKGAGHHNGPNLWNIFGREAASKPGFERYSEALREMDFRWTPELLFAWLAKPNRFIPGSTMVAAPIPDPQDRADLVAYLETFSPAHRGHGDEPATSNE